MKIRLDLSERLEQAIRKQELSVYFQPIMDLRKNRLSGAEALLRWDEPELGFVAPDVFIPIAEETGQIRELGGLVLEQSIHALSRWNRILPEGACALASCLVNNTTLTALNLGCNELCAINSFGQGQYNTDGIEAIASFDVVTMEVVNASDGARRLHKLISLGEMMPKDGMFARQARRKFGSA